MTTWNNKYYIIIKAFKIHKIKKISINFNFFYKKTKIELNKILNKILFLFRILMGKIREMNHG